MILELVRRTFNITIDDETRQYLFEQIKSNIKSVEIEEWHPQKKSKPDSVFEPKPIIPPVPHK